ncbi:MAG: DUF6574 domain-containing protein [Streptococcus sp.]|nr:DUF6574 domain-containing protein [Streptococcus sp.]
MSKQDWLDYFEAVNGRSASAEEIAQALAAGEFQDEVAAPQAPEFVAAPQEPVAAPQAPEFVAAPQEPAPQAAPTNGPAFQQAPQQAYQQPVQPGYQQNPYQGQPYPAQPSQFGVAVGGYWSWFVSALKRPTAVNQPKALNGILQYVFTAFVMTLATFFTASGYTGGYGVDFRAFLIILIMVYFNIYAYQVAGFFIRRVVLQDKEYSYGRSFEEFGRLSVYTLPISLFAFLVGLVKAYEFYGFLNALVFFLFAVGTLYVVYQALNKTKFKADKFLLLVASIAILIVFAGLVVYLDRQILEQAIMGSIPSTPNFGNLGNLGY